MIPTDEDLELLRTLVEGAERGEFQALATIVHSRGSTPRKEGARMVVGPDGRVRAGTVGGGCGEGEVLEAARRTLVDGRTRQVTVDLTEDLLTLSPAVCGGIMEIRVERVAPAVTFPGLPRPIRIRYHRPPDRTTIYRQSLVHDDGRVKVTFARDLDFDAPIQVDGEPILEPGADAVWFTFPGAWHDIGRFHRADGTFTGVYANVITPCVFEPGGEWETTDLFLDLWIPAGGGPPQLLDEAELQEAEDAGALSPRLASRARKEAARLLEEARQGQWPPPIVHEWTRERITLRKRGPSRAGPGRQSSA